MMMPFCLFFFKLLTIFVSAKLASYIKFYQNNKDFIDSLGEYCYYIPQITIQHIYIYICVAF